MKNLIFISLLLCSSPFLLFSQIGPEQGSLIIIGGGGMTAEMIENFADMMGGYDEEMIVIPTSTTPQNINLNSQRQVWLNAGFSKVTVLHTTDPSIADTEAFIMPIKTAAGIYFGGGRQWRTIDAYKHTLAEEEFHNLLERGGVIMGSSAGASVQGSFLARGAQASNVPIIAPEENHRVGFGFLKNSAIDQHADTRNRWKDMYEIIDLEPQLLGFSIAETTAMFVQADCFEVLGLGQVAIHDSTRIKACNSPNDICYELIEAGDFFDLRNRETGNCDPVNTTNDKLSKGQDQIRLFPNPATDLLNIKWNYDSSKYIKLSIINMMGQSVQQTIISNTGHYSTQLAHLENGFYFIKLQAEGYSQLGKFIKE